MKFLFLLAAISCSCVFSVRSQDYEQLKRKPYILEIAVDKNNTYQDYIIATPYVYPNNTVRIFPGETIFIEIEQYNGTINKMTAVREIKDPAKTVRIKFAQACRKKIHEAMRLEIYNPFAKDLSYDANLLLVNQNKWHKTNTLPVHAGVTSFKTWSDIVITLALDNWKFLK